jgi:hypothetical protein
MLRIIAILFGIAFIFVGVAGFLPSFTTDNLLVGYFAVDSTHNIVHIVTGVLAIMAATSARYARIYFQVIGILYSVLAIVGFWRGGNMLIMQMTTADNFLHAAVGIAALYLGYFVKKEQA